MNIKYKIAKAIQKKILEGLGNFFFLISAKGKKITEKLLAPYVVYIFLLYSVEWRMFIIGYTHAQQRFVYFIEK